MPDATPHTTTPHEAPSPDTRSSAREPNADAPAPLVEVGWVVVGRVDAVDREAVQQARAAVLRYFREQFPAFRWQMPVTWRKEARPPSPAEPIRLLDIGASERDAHRWDLAFVITAVELKSYYKSFTLGTPSSALDTALISTARLDPAASIDQADRDERVATTARRLRALFIHLFGHLNDLPHQDDPGDFMYDLRTVGALDQMHTLADHERLHAELNEIAQERLEESADYRGQSGRDRVLRFWFGLRVLGQELGDVLRTIGHIKPWLFPLRFSRMTTAAVSTLLILMMTAEAWDLGMSQPLARVALLSVVALLGTSGYIIKRQRLLMRRQRARLSEQRVIAQMSVTGAVVLGMLTVYLGLFATVLGVGTALFAPDLIGSWAASLQGAARPRHFVALAGFLATLGLLTGALGASFEQESYFRHVALLDEET